MNESRPIRYSYPVHSLDESATYEGIKREANAVRQRRRDARKAPRVLVTRYELLHDIVFPLALVISGLAALYALFLMLAHLAAKGVLPLR